MKYYLSDKMLWVLNFYFYKCSYYLNNFSVPKLIILKKNAYIYQNIDKNIDNFCTLYDGNLYVVYGSLVGDNICKTIKNL